MYSCIVLCEININKNNNNIIDLSGKCGDQEGTTNVIDYLFATIINVCLL